MRLSLRIVAACCAGLAGAAFVASDLRFVREEPAAPPDLAWLPPPAPPATARVRRVSPFGEGPCRFEPNLGQSPAAVRFVCRGPGHATFLEDAAFTTLVPAARGAPESARAFAYRVRFDGAAARPVAAAEQSLPGRTNYFVGRDESSWVRGVPNFARVRYAEVWPGIEVVWHGANGTMEYDFVVAPGADPRRIALAVEGAETCSIDAAGDLVLTGAGTEMRHKRPRIVQQTDSGLREVPGAFAMDGASRVRIDVGAHDPSLPLRIDPAVTIRAGGAAFDSVDTLAVAKDDTIALMGQTPSVTFLPSSGPLFATGKGLSDAYAVTYGLGGGSPVAGWTAIVGSSGDECFTDGQFGPEKTLFLVGFTTLSSAYPTVRAPQTSGLGGQDGTFVAIDPTGSRLVFSGGIGGSGHDLATSIALVPSASNPTVTAEFVGLVTQSSDVPFAGSPAIPVAPGQGDGMVLSFTPGGVQTAGTYLGGNADETMNGLYVALAQDKGVACAFSTHSALTTTPGAFQSARGGGSIDGFVLRLPPTLSTITASTFITGPASDLTLSGLVARPGGGFVVCGTHQAGTLPVTPNATPQQKPGQGDGALFQLTESLDAAPLVTYYGGPQFEDANGVICPTTATAFVSGTALQGRSAVGGGDPHHGSGADLYVQQVPLTGAATPFVTNVGSTQFEFGAQYSGNNLTAYVGRPLGITSDGLVLFAWNSSATDQEYPVLLGTAGGQQDLFLTSVTQTATGGPSTFAIDVDLVKADLTNSSGAHKDSVHLSGTFDPGPAVIDFSPGAVGSFALQVNERFVTGTASVIDLDVPLTDSRWKATKGGDVMTWTSAKGVLPVVKIVVDQARDAFKVDLTKLDLPPAPLVPGRFDVDLGLAGAEGTAAEPWTAAGPTRLRFRVLNPSQILTGKLVVAPATVPLGTPFTTTATLLNRGTTPIQGQLRFFHKTFNYQSWMVTVPGRDSLTLEPGTLDMSTMVAVPSAGKGQLFRLFLDNTLLGSAKGNVTKP